MATSKGSRRTIAGAMNRHLSVTSITLMRIPAASASRQVRRLSSGSPEVSITSRAPARSPSR